MTVDATFDEAIYQCPVTGKPLVRRGDFLETEDAGHSYRIADGIAVLTPDAGEVSTSRNIIEWYDKFGWNTDADGTCNETLAVAHTKKVQLKHTTDCIARIGRYFENGGEYLLDVGCGAIPHDSLLAYSNTFRKRICIDLSVTGLKQAQKRLGDKGVYICGDASRIPLASNSVDAVTCNHLIYQLPVALQRAAILEIWRVLKPGGVAVIVYWWSYSGIATRLEEIGRRLAGRRSEAPAPVDAAAPVHRDEDEPQLRSWFESQSWPFDYTLDSYRLVHQDFMKTYVSDNALGGALLSAFLLAQNLFPRTCGRYGQYPAIVIRK